MKTHAAPRCIYTAGAKDTATCSFAAATVIGALSPAASPPGLSTRGASTGQNPIEALFHTGSARSLGNAFEPTVGLSTAESRRQLDLRRVCE